MWRLKSWPKNAKAEPLPQRELQTTNEKTTNKQANDMKKTAMNIRMAAGAAVFYLIMLPFAPVALAEAIGEWLAAQRWADAWACMASRAARSVAGRRR